MARATHLQVIADFGEVRPFVDIVEAENRPAEALEGLLGRYGVPLPPDTWPGRVHRYTSLREACEAAVGAEIDNGGMYVRLIAGTDRTDISAVYRNLQAASQERHLPAFRRCVGRGNDASGDGVGGRRRRGGG